MKDGHSKMRPKYDYGRTKENEVTTKEWTYCDSSLVEKKTEVRVSKSMQDVIVVGGNVGDL